MPLNSIVQKILEDRNIEDLEEFLSSKPQLTHDPSLFQTMEGAVDLILDAIDQGKKICIYGDYDVDGITATTLLVSILRHLEANVTYFIPSRFDDGYGLNNDSLRLIKEGGADLVVTVDCGIVSVAEVEYAKELGLDIIITDHHDVGGELPDAIVIDPKVPGIGYPFRELSGCGVAFKLAQAIQREAGLERSKVTALLDLVAVATVADIVPLFDENRTLVKYGLGLLNSGNNEGLSRLIEKVGLKLGEIKSEQIAYIVAPHINAAGRMGKARIAVDMLLSNDSDTIEQTTDYLIEQNNKRKAVQEDAYERCVEIVESALMDDPILLIDAGDIHEGIVGIVAGKVKSKYNKPTLVMIDDGEAFKGSGRSVEGIDIHEIMLRYEHIFDKFGGHSMACGFTVQKSKFEALRTALIRDFAEIDGAFERRYDAVVKSEDITEQLVKDLETLEPFGKGNEAPEFFIEDALVNNIVYMGNKEQHARFIADNLQCTYFNCKDVDLSEGSCSIYGSPKIDTWKGRKTLKFNVRGIE